MFDLIGDIHGHADELVHLLELLGYDRRQGHYEHPTRQAVFVGDFIDRGPQIREVLQIVRPMVENGSALSVMGNHEFNALAYHTQHPDEPDQFLRPHIEKNVKQHAETIRQVPLAELDDYLDWFRTLPMWLELEGLRVVHACWDAKQIEVIDEAQNAYEGVSTDFLCEATTNGSQLYQAIEDVLKGKEANLPDGTSYWDKDGNERHAMRIKWYGSPENETYASYALTVDDGLPSDPLPSSLVESVMPYPTDADPVLFGHYWLRAERPSRLATNVACLDFSVAKGGSLCAYRWDGEQELSNDKFFSVPSKQA